MCAEEMLFKRLCLVFNFMLGTRPTLWRNAKNLKVYWNRLEFDVCWFRFQSIEEIHRYKEIFLISFWNLNVLLSLVVESKRGIAILGFKKYHKKSLWGILMFHFNQNQSDDKSYNHKAHQKFDLKYLNL